MADAPGRHPLEDELNASAVDILDAVSAGFRAKIDVKGKLAELYLSRSLETLRRAGAIQDFQWHDKDGESDFTVEIDGVTIVLECKNVRSPVVSRAKRPRKVGADAVRVELQKTRNSKDGKNTRGYRHNEFDVIAVCLFNQTRRWDYLLAPSRRLTRRTDDPDLLDIYHPVPLTPSGHWGGDLLEVLKAEAAEKAAGDGQAAPQGQRVKPEGPRLL